MKLDRLDLNLLKAFDALIEEGTVTAAAARLGCTQPALSNALRRLRVHFDDPLFVRTTRGMQPTSLASRLAPSISAALSGLRAALEQGEKFEPARSRRRFVLLTIDLGEVNLLPRLYPTLARVAPYVTFVTERRPYDRYRQALESGEADLAWGRIPRGHVDFVQQRLFVDPWVCVVRKGHPRIRNSLSMEQFLEEKHLVLDSPTVPPSLVPGALGRRATRRQVVLRISNYLAIPQVVERSDLVSVIPAALGERIAGRYKVKVLELPFRIPASEIHQFWHKRAHDDPGHQWIRGLIADVFRRRDPSNA